MKNHLDIKNLFADYYGNRVLNGITFNVERASIVSLIGPSGSGKSTILRVLAGLLPPTGGDIRLDDELIDYNSAADIKKVRSKLAIVFQQYNLFQNMTALGNVTVAPTKVQKRDRKEVEGEARILFEKVGLSDKLHSYPDELSGGQQQRVAIARALALKPEVLLLDEVTAALDPELVKEVLDTIRLLAEEGMTMITVSHEMGFVSEVSSKVAFLDGGKIVESGTPQEIFRNPQKDRTRMFLGQIMEH